jgi:hypothetical protein
MVIKISNNRATGFNLSLVTGLQRESTDRAEDPRQLSAISVF